MLFFIWIHSLYYFKKSKGKYITFWEKTILYLIITVALDTICWFINGQPGSFFFYSNYVFNIMLFTILSLFTTMLATFINLSATYDAKTQHNYRIASIIVVSIVFVLCILSVPFGFIFKVDPVTNLYSRGNLYYIMVAIMISPIVYATLSLFRKFGNYSSKVIQNNKPLILLIVCDLFLSAFFLILQGKGIIEISLLFPVNALGILCLHFLIITNTITIDYLSGMKNRLGLERYLGRLPKYINDYFALIYIDLNDFKSINDSFGHMIGDQAIKEFSDIILSEIRGKDLAARIGGDEFVIVKIVKEPEHAQKVVQAIQRSIDEFNSRKDKSYKLNFSYGISYTKPKEIIDKEKLLEDADKLMYENKKRTKKEQS